MNVPRPALLLPAALLAAAAAWYLSQWTAAIAQPDSWRETDYQLHWAAGRAWAAGLDPYDPAAVAPIGAPTGRDVTPFCAAAPLFVRGFAWLGERSFAEGYRWLLSANTVLLLLAIALLAAALVRAGVPGAAALAAALALVACNDGTWMSLWFNQLNFITLAALAGALWAGLAGRPRLEGALLAVAAWSKLSPALLVVLAAVAGRWRTVRAAVVTGLVLLALSVALAGWDAHLQWLAMAQRELGFAAQRPVGLFNNSLHGWNLAPNGVLSRASDAAGWPRAVPVAGAWAAALLAAGLAAWALRRVARGYGYDGATTIVLVHALGIAAGFLASSTTWVTHLSTAAVPLACLTWLAWQGRAAWLVRAGAALAGVLLMLPLGALTAEATQRVDIRAKLVGCVILLASLVAAALAAAQAPGGEASAGR
jgi:hypothetical protein